MTKKLNKDPQKLHEYLLVRPVPVVVRSKRFYLVDHHHLVRALYKAAHELHGKNVAVYGKVAANATTLGGYFWKWMHRLSWVYLFDAAGGGPQQPEKLPAHVKDLAFDPYRGIAWIVREHRGYLKNDAPFSEFKWANFFRTRILLDQDILAGKHTFDEFAFEVDAKGRLELSDDGKEVIEEALFLAAGIEARGMPGFIGSISQGM